MTNDNTVTPEVSAIPELSEGEKEIVEERTALRAVVIHEAIREQGETELARPVVALAWSGLAAGLSMGFSMISEGLLESYLPAASWRPLISKLGYTVGFLVVILGRQQLFTENTLTVILPLLARRTAAALLSVIRLWMVVLTANLIGALAIAALVGHTVIFDTNVRKTFTEMGVAAIAAGPFTIFLRAIFAGWLIALTVWMLPAVEASRPGHNNPVDLPDCTGAFLPCNRRLSGGPL
jgi:formate-nitrite transporter family protein